MLVKPWGLKLLIITLGALPFFESLTKAPAICYTFGLLKRAPEGERSESGYNAQTALEMTNMDLDKS